MMLNDTTIKSEGMKILAKHLGILEAERFVVLIHRDTFDYTEWQRTLFDDLSLEQLLQNAAAFRTAE